MLKTLHSIAVLFPLSKSMRWERKKYIFNFVCSQEIVSVWVRHKAKVYWFVQYITAWITSIHIYIYIDIFHRVDSVAVVCTVYQCWDFCHPLLYIEMLLASAIPNFASISPNRRSTGYVLDWIYMCFMQQQQTFFAKCVYLHIFDVFSGK